MNNKNELETYYIPHNFEDAGGFLKGLVKKRNLIEGSLMGGISGFLLFNYLPTSKTANGLFERTLIVVIVAVPLILFGFFGINGEALSLHLVAFFKFKKNKRKLMYKEAVLIDNKKKSKN